MSAAVTKRSRTFVSASPSSLMLRAVRREASTTTYTSCVRSIWKTFVTGWPRFAEAFQWISLTLSPGM